jgi:hypothetical protein
MGVKGRKANAVEIDGAATGGPPPSTPKQIRDFVHKFDPYSFLEAIAELARHEHTGDALSRKFPRVANTWGLADLARYVIQHGDPHRSRPAHPRDVLQGMNYVNGVVEPLRDIESVFGFLYRTGIKQFPAQQEPRQRIARMLMLFGDLPESVGTGGYDIGRRFKDVAGMTVSQFTWVTFALWGRSMLAQERPDHDHRP